jgi:hypothetical protein
VEINAPRLSQRSASASIPSEDCVCVCVCACVCVCVCVLLPIDTTLIVEVDDNDELAHSDEQKPIKSFADTVKVLRTYSEYSPARKYVCVCVCVYLVLVLHFACFVNLQFSLYSQNLMRTMMVLLMMPRPTTGTKKEPITPT